MNAVFEAERMKTWRSEGQGGGGENENSPRGALPAVDWENFITEARENRVARGVFRRLDRMKEVIERDPFAREWLVRGHVFFGVPEMQGFLDEYKKYGRHIGDEVLALHLRIDCGRTDENSYLVKGAMRIERDVATAETNLMEVSQSFFRTPYFNLLAEQLGAAIKINQIEVYAHHDNKTAVNKGFPSWRLWATEDWNKLDALWVSFRFSYVDPKISSWLAM